MSFSDLCPVLAYLELLLGQQDTTVAVISPYDFCLDIIARLKYISQFFSFLKSNFPNRKNSVFFAAEVHDRYKLT